MDKVAFSQPVGRYQAKFIHSK